MLVFCGCVVVSVVMLVLWSGEISWADTRERWLAGMVGVEGVLGYV